MARTRPDLTAFVRAKRARLSPDEVGIATTGHRRVAGLRREEVAALANVGLTWYTWFEQGRDVHVSEAFLLAVAKALRLDDDECRHLFILAHQRPPAAEAYLPPGIDDALQQVLDALSAPAFVLNLRRDVLAGNTAAAGTFGDALAPGGNLLRSVFLDPTVRALMPAWADDAAALAVAFRRDSAIVPDDPLMRALAQELSANATFRATADPATRSAGRYGLSAWRDARFEQVVLLADQHRHLRVIVHLPVGQR